VHLGIADLGIRAAINIPRTLRAVLRGPIDALDVAVYCELFAGEAML
jgi:hypothetical protein